MYFCVCCTCFFFENKLLPKMRLSRAQAVPKERIREIERGGGGGERERGLVLSRGVMKQETRS